MGEVLSANELGRRLDVAPNTVNQWRRAGKIPGVVIAPRTIRYDWDAVRAALGLLEKPEDIMKEVFGESVGEGESNERPQ